MTILGVGMDIFWNHKVWKKVPTAVQINEAFFFVHVVILRQMTI